MTSDVEVILLSDGEVTPEGTRYELAVVNKADQVVKASQQADPEQKEQGMTPWVEPRISFRDLLYFYDVNTWHKRAINLKARLVGGLGWMLTTEDKNKDADKQHEAITRLLKNPQSMRRPGETKRSLTDIVYRFLIDWYSAGNAFLETPRNAAGEVAELYHLRAAPLRRDRDLSKGYHQLVQGQSRVHFRGFGGEEPAGMNELLHFDQYDPLDDYYGAPEWLPAMAAMLLDRTAVEYNTFLFRNGLMAHFVVVVEGGKLETKHIEALKTFLRENATGIQNAGRGIVLQNEKDGVRIRIEKLNIDFKDLQFRDGRAFSRDEVASMHGVPPRLLGVMSAGALGGGGETEGQLKIFYEAIIRPDQERVEDFLNSTVIASFGGEQGLDAVKWRLKFQEMDITDAAADASYYSVALNPQTGWMRRDEVRELEGLRPEDEEEGALVEKALQNGAATADFLAALRKRLEQ